MCCLDDVTAQEGQQGRVPTDRQTAFLKLGHYQRQEFVIVLDPEIEKGEGASWKNSADHCEGALKDLSD